MKQSRLMSFVESAINIAVGFGISLGAQVLFLPMLGVSIDFHQNFVFALIMTAISICRQFILRRVFEALHIRRPLSPFMQAVIAERFRQIAQEGWSHEHDDYGHLSGDLARAGACYALHAKSKAGEGAPGEWRWDSEWWKPTDFRRNLVKAGALIIADGERHDRLKNRWSRNPIDPLAPVTSDQHPKPVIDPGWTAGAAQDRRNAESRHSGNADEGRAS